LPCFSSFAFKNGNFRGLTGLGVISLSASNSVLANIARPYAAALFDLASETKSIAKVEKDLSEMGTLISSNEDLSRLLTSPVISAEAKTAAVEKILTKAKLNETVANFIRAVARNGRLFVLPTMIEVFGELCAKSRGEISAEVISAAPLNKKQLDDLAKTLKNKTGKTVALDTSVDPSLIGGLVVRVGSQMIDSSLKTKLSAMKIAMKEVR